MFQVVQYILQKLQVFMLLSNLLVSSNEPVRQAVNSGFFYKSIYTEFTTNMNADEYIQLYSFRGDWKNNGTLKLFEHVYYVHSTDTYLYVHIYIKGFAVGHFRLF